MSILSRGTKGIRAAMRHSYEKHAKLARMGKIGAPSDPPHLTGLFGALETRNNVCGIVASEATNWLELSPFIYMDEEQAVSLLSVYAAYRELPWEITEDAKTYLILHLNIAVLKAFEKEPWSIRAILDQRLNFLWIHLLSDATLKAIADRNTQSIAKEPDSARTASPTAANASTATHVVFGKDLQDALWRIAKEDYPKILRISQDVARVGIVPPTVEAIFNAYLELAIFYMCTICVLFSMTEAYDKTVEHEIETLLKSALVSLDAEVEGYSWQQNDNLVHMLGLFDTRYLQYRRFYQTPNPAPSTLVQMIGDFLMETGKGHAVVYSDELLAETIHVHTAKVVHIARATYDTFTDLLHEFYNRS